MQVATNYKEKERQALVDFHDQVDSGSKKHCTLCHAT